MVLVEGRAVEKGTHRNDFKLIGLSRWCIDFNVLLDLLLPRLKFGIRSIKGLRDLNRLSLPSVLWFQEGAESSVKSFSQVTAVIDLTAIIVGWNRNHGGSE